MAEHSRAPRSTSEPDWRWIRQQRATFSAGIVRRAVSRTLARGLNIARMFLPSDYFKHVVVANRGLDGVEKSERLFMVPGTNHCSGGAGAVKFGLPSVGPPPSVPLDSEHDVFLALQRWVEKGVAPNYLLAETDAIRAMLLKIRFSQQALRGCYAHTPRSRAIPVQAIPIALRTSSVRTPLRRN
jgi:hypothetical protein